MKDVVAVVLAGAITVQIRFNGRNVGVSARAAGGVERAAYKRTKQEDQSALAARRSQFSTSATVNVLVAPRRHERLRISVIHAHDSYPPTRPPCSVAPAIINRFVDTSF